MLNLTASTDKIEIITSAAVAVSAHTSWVDYASGVATPGRTNSNVATATTQTITAGPASGQRNVKTINIRNKSTTTSVDITINFDENGTDYELHKVTLRPGEVLEYIEGVGWYTLTVVAAQLRTMKLGADQSNSTVSLTEVTGISLATGLGTFTFRYDIIYQAAAATTGVRFSVNHAGTVTQFVAYELFGAGTTASADAPDQDMVAAGAQIMSNFAARAKSTTGWGTTLSVDTAGADMYTIIEGIVTVTVDGEIELWHGSEVAAASTVKAGTSLTLIRTGD